MIYSRRISTASGVTEADPDYSRIVLEKGVIHQLVVAFPPGAEGLLHVRLEQGNTKIYPAGEDRDVAWDNIPLNYNTWIDLTDAPYELVAVTWNEDTAYAHDVLLQFNIDPEELLRPPQVDAGILQRLQSFFLGR